MSAWQDIIVNLTVRIRETLEWIFKSLGNFYVFLVAHDFIKVDLFKKILAYIEISKTTGLLDHILTVDIFK